MAHLYGRDDSDVDDFSIINGRGYPLKIFSRGGLSTEIEMTIESCILTCLPRSGLVSKVTNSNFLFGASFGMTVICEQTQTII